MKRDRIRHWLITDTHFGHKNMIEYCNRPPDFANRILKNTEQMVRPQDILIHLGDICIGQDGLWNATFNAVTPDKTWLIRGNHDKKSNTWYYDQGWMVVADRLDLQIYGFHVALSHRPLVDDGSFEINVHGHHHITGHHPEDEVGGKHKLIFVEHEYRPVLLRTVLGA